MKDKDIFLFVSSAVVGYLAASILFPRRGWATSIDNETKRHMIEALQKQGMQNLGQGPGGTSTKFIPFPINASPINRIPRNVTGHYPEPGEEFEREP